MTPLRQRMIDDMRLAGFAERTRDVYIQAVRRIAWLCGRAIGDGCGDLGARVWSVPTDRCRCVQERQGVGRSDPWRVRHAQAQSLALTASGHGPRTCLG